MKTQTLIIRVEYDDEKKKNQAIGVGAD